MPRQTEVVYMVYINYCELPVKQELEKQKFTISREKKNVCVTVKERTGARWQVYMQQGLVVPDKGEVDV